MKKRVTRWIVMLAAVCSMMLFPAITGYAADGTLMLSDPEGTVGGEIPVNVRIDAGGQPIGDANVILMYDAALLEFVSGTNAEGADGIITLSAAGTGTETELVFQLKFKGLAEGTAAITVAESTAYLFSDETLNLSAGEAAVTIGPGDGTTPSSEPTERVLGQESIELDGAIYAIYENFTDALIPAGFSRTTVQYAGAEHSAIRQDASGKVILFMITGEEDPIMVIYNESDSTFARTERVDISDQFSLFILSSGDGSTLPENFVETSLILHDVSFPAWQNMDSTDFYLVYGLSSGGTEGFYQFDSVDRTYQRYVAQSTQQAAPEPEEEEDDSKLGKLQKVITDNLLILAAAVAVIVVILFIIILVLSIKLGRRNAELEDMYVGDEDGNKPNVKKKSREQFVGYDDDDDDDDDYLDDDFDDSEYDDDFADSDDAYGDEYGDEYYDDDDDFDDEEDIKEYVPGKKDASEKKDSYEDIDFIDV